MHQADLTTSCRSYKISAVIILFTPKNNSLKLLAYSKFMSAQENTPKLKRKIKGSIEGWMKTSCRKQ